uniref:Core-binding (CB) domain-containing protein n=1 Tax=Xenopus tropicalis TaxID=8364 RepID=A0A803JEU1_XENTR
MSPIRVGNLSKGVYKSTSAVNSRIEETRYPGLSLSRRYPAQSKECGGSSEPQRFCDKDFARTWLGAKFSKESIAANTGSSLSRCKISNKPCSSHITRGKEAEVKRSNIQIVKETYNVSERDIQYHRAIELDSSDGEMGALAYQTIAMGLFNAMEEEETELESDYSDNASSEDRNEMVAGGSQSNQRADVEGYSVGGTHDRFQPQRLGSPSEKYRNTRSMVRGRTVSPSKYSGAQSGLEGNSRTGRAAEGSIFDAESRQLSSSSLSEEARRNAQPQLNEGIATDYAMDGGLLAEHVGSSCSGGSKRTGRFPQQSDNEQARVGTESRGVPTNSGEMGVARERLDGVPKQSQGQSILFKGQRCFDAELEHRALVHFSSDTPDIKSLEKDKSREGRSHSYPPGLAEETVVSSAQIHVNGQTTETTDQEGSVNARPNVSSGPAGISTQGLEIERQRLVSEGFSMAVIDTMLAARKMSTNKTYDRVWKVFLAWLQQKNILLQDLSVIQILDFLQAGFEKGLSLRTLKLQVSAISALTEKQWAKDTKIIKFVTGVMHLRPPCRVWSAAWDLQLVLEVLTADPFEPLEEISEMLLTLKMVFLTAVVSARRVSDLQALSAEPPFTIIQQDKVILRAVPGYLPKVVKNFYLNQETILPSFFSNYTSELEKTWHMLDMVRCMTVYLKRTKTWRKSNRLFVIPNGNRRGQAASVTTISRWIVNCIKLAYQKKEKQFPKGVRAHSTRALSTSWAFQAEVSAEHICKTASWNSARTFLKHYQVEVRAKTQEEFGSKVLEAVCGSKR